MSTRYAQRHRALQRRRSPVPSANHVRLGRRGRPHHFKEMDQGDLTALGAVDQDVIQSRVRPLKHALQHKYGDALSRSNRVGISSGSLCLCAGSSWDGVADPAKCMLPRQIWSFCVKRCGYTYRWYVKIWAAFSPDLWDGACLTSYRHALPRESYQCSWSNGTKKTLYFPPRTQAMKTPFPFGRICLAGCWS